MKHPLTKSVQEVEKEQQEHLEGRLPVYETQIQKFVRKFGNWLYDNVSIRGLPDENDRRYQ